MMIIIICLLFTTVATSLSVSGSLLQPGQPCGDHWDGTWVAVLPEALDGPQVVRTGPRVSCDGTGSKPNFLQARLGDWTYRVLDVVMRNGSTGSGLQVFVGWDWMSMMTGLENATQSIEGLTKVTHLFGEGASVWEGEDGGPGYRVSRLAPGQGRHLVLMRDNGKKPVWVEDMLVCVEQIDFSTDGQPVTPRGAMLLNSMRSSIMMGPGQPKNLISKATMRQATLTAECPGYPGSSNPTCSDGKVCVGTYISHDCSQTCQRSPYGTEVTTPCQNGDIDFGGKPDCGIVTDPRTGQGYAYFPQQMKVDTRIDCGARICGSCTSCTSPEVLRLEKVSISLPSSPNQISPSQNAVEASAEVSNAGSTPQKPSVTFKFTTTISTTMKLSKTTAESTKNSLKLPIPQVGLNFAVEEGESREMTSGETTQRTATIDVKYTINIGVPAKTKMKVTATAFTSNVVIRAPVKYRIYYSCGDSQEVDDEVEFSSSGVIGQTGSNLQVRYDSEPLE